MVDKIYEIVNSGVCSYSPKMFNPEEVFSWEELEILINNTAFSNTSRVQVFGAKPYSWEEYAWGSDINSWPTEILGEILENSLVVVSDASRVSKPINLIAGTLEKASKGAADLHIFASLKEGLPHPFEIHWDYSSNFIVQVEGISDWVLWDTLGVEGGVQNLNELESYKYLGTPSVRCTMEPGDVLYVPKGCWHGVTSSNRRMSLSFPIKDVGKNPNVRSRYWIDLISDKK